MFNLVKLPIICILNFSHFIQGESLICSFDRKPMDLKELCKVLRKNVLKNLKSERVKNSKDTDEKNPRPQEFFDEFPDSAYDLLKKLLELDCDKRLSAENALKHQFFAE